MGNYSSDPTQRTEADAVAAIALKSVQPLHFPTRAGVVVLPSGVKVNLEDESLADNPKRPRAVVNLYEVESFIAYVNSFKKLNHTVIFGKATETSASFKGIIDYHEKAAQEATAAGPLAGWGEHICNLTLSVTPEWKRWLDNNGRAMTQEQFAEFIEDNGLDILNPDAATLFDMATFLKVKKTVMFKSARSLRNGQATLEYSEAMEEGSGRRDDSTQFPGIMVVRLIPFVGAAGADITARLRYRISESGKLTFTYVLDRPFKVLEAAFAAMDAKIETETSIPVMLGDGSVSPLPSR